MPPLKPDRDKTFGGSLVFDFGQWWRHVKTIYCFRFSGPVPPCRVWRYSPGKIPANLVQHVKMTKKTCDSCLKNKISKKLSMFQRSERQLQAAWTVCKVHRWIFASESSRHQGHFSDDMCWTLVDIRSSERLKDGKRPLLHMMRSSPPVIFALRTDNFPVPLLCTHFWLWQWTF